MTNVLDLVAYKNGEYKPLGEIGPSVLDFGFIHCDATYDVMPVYNRKAFCYDRHLQRFKNSAERYGLTIPDVDPLEIIKELANRNPIDNAFVWFIIWRGFPPSGNPRDIKNCPVNFAMYIKPSYPIASTPLVRLYLDKNTNRVNDDYYGQEYKNMSWIDLTISQRSTPTGFDTTVLVDVDGYVTEGPGFNVGIVKDNVIKTSAKNVLKGITMSVVEDIAKENNITFKRMPITQSMFLSADEVFITSSSGGVTPTTVVGDITNLLVSQYNDKKIKYGTIL
jgi:branched-chain amino acid aminotransferase